MTYRCGSVEIFNVCQALIFENPTVHCEEGHKICYAVSNLFFVHKYYHHKIFFKEGLICFIVFRSLFKYFLHMPHKFNGKCSILFLSDLHYRGCSALAYLITCTDIQKISMASKLALSEAGDLIYKVFLSILIKIQQRQQQYLNLLYQIMLSSTDYGTE